MRHDRLQERNRIPCAVSARGKLENWRILRAKIGQLAREEGESESESESDQRERGSRWDPRSTAYIRTNKVRQPYSPLRALMNTFRIVCRLSFRN